MRYILLAIYLSALIGCSGSSGDSDNVQVTIDTNSSNSKNIEEAENKIVNGSDLSDVTTGSNIEKIKTPNNIDMEQNKPYFINRGDKIQEIDNAKIRVIKNSEADNFQVILIGGQAKIIKGNN